MFCTTVCGITIGMILNSFFYGATAWFLLLVFPSETPRSFWSLIFYHGLLPGAALGGIIAYFSDFKLLRGDLSKRIGYFCFIVATATAWVLHFRGFAGVGELDLIRMFLFQAMILILVFPLSIVLSSFEFLKEWDR